MIILKTSDEIECIASASRIVADAQQALVKEVRPGITTAHLDLLAEEYIRSRGGNAGVLKDIEIIQKPCVPQ